MHWFRKHDRGLKTDRKREIPEGLWTKCPGCGEIAYKKELERNLWTCTKCEYHMRISARDYIALLVKEGSFVETESGLAPRDPLGFVDSKPYPQRLRAAQEKTGLLEAVVTGEGQVEETRCMLASLDFGFMGGSMGSVVGEKVTRAIRRSVEEGLPFLSISASGGARMQEGILSLMQLAKVSAALALLAEARLVHISILTHPTTGGVTASFASLGDLIFAEPGALVGFAGPRVIQQTIKQELPEGFQRSEFLLRHGMVDRVVKRKEMRATVAQALRFFCADERFPRPALT